MSQQVATTVNPPQAAGYLLTKVGLLALLAGMLAAAWLGQAVIVALLGLVVASAVTAKSWSRLSLKSVVCQRTLSEQRVFPGETIELRLKLSNRKLLPLPWIQAEDEVPLAFGDGAMLLPAERPGNGLLSNSATMLWYTSVNWRHTLLCSRRGYYSIGPLKLTSGDIFGFYPRVRNDENIDHVIVYPRIFPLQRLGIESLYPMGDSRSTKRMFEDPTRVIGVREYTPQDSLKRIHWKATARLNSLQVKVFEPTATQNVAIFLAVDQFAQGDAAKEAEFELGISAAASVARYFIEQGSPVGLYANSRLADSGQAATIPPGSSPGQLTAILEALAKVTSTVSGPFEPSLQSGQAGLPWGTTTVIVLARASESTLQLIAGLWQSGQKLLVLQCGGEGPGPQAAGVPWQNIGEITATPASSGAP